MMTHSPQSADSATQRCVAVGVEPPGVPTPATAVSHDVTARQSPTGQWLLSCVCGWSVSPTVTLEEVQALGEAHYDACDNTAAEQAGPDRPAMIDIGPATPPPSWCPAGIEPEWQTLTAAHGGGPVCLWEYDVSVAVFVASRDVVAGGRVLRAAPGIHIGDETPNAGWTANQARQIASDLIAAADLLEKR